LFWVALCLPVMLLAAVIREREQAEDVLHDQRNQLAHVTRVATVGELSGAIAHELRQPLASILANAETALILLDRQAADRAELRAIVSDIAQHDRQAASVIARLRSFMREGQTRSEPLAVESVVRDALALGRSMVDMWSVDVQVQFGVGLPHVRGDPVQLLQVILNLVVNGCEAMASNPAGSRRLQIRVTHDGRRHIDVQIADSGAGLPKGREDQVFEPFFTTKDAGLGLGLAIGRSIAAAHGGELWGESNAQGGATFHLLLPTDVDGHELYASSGGFPYSRSFIRPYPPAIDTGASRSVDASVLTSRMRGDQRAPGPSNRHAADRGEDIPAR
jgi:C4-dicarboxylate-specific signal transduction histidine kinase